MVLKRTNLTLSRITKDKRIRMLEFNNILQILPIRNSIPSVMFVLCGEVTGLIINELLRE